MNMRHHASSFPLHCYREQFRSGFMSRTQLEELLFAYLTGHPKTYQLQTWDSGEYLDLMSWVYPRVRRAVDNYEERGSNFDAYVAALVRWAAREYRFTALGREQVEQSFWYCQALEETVWEGEPSYDEEKPFPPVKNPRQVLVLLLKSYQFVSDDFIRRCAPSLNMRAEEIHDMIARLRELREKDDQETLRIRRRYRNLYYRGLCYEGQLQGLEQGTPYYERLRERIQRIRYRMNRLQKRLQRIRLSASNRDVAEVMGISKGTVDAHMHALKKHRKKSEKAKPILE